MAAVGALDSMTRSIMLVMPAWRFFPVAQRNRPALLGVMTAAGWDFYRYEWWHYQLFNARRYPLYSETA